MDRRDFRSATSICCLLFAVGTAMGASAAMRAIVESLPENLGNPELAALGFLDVSAAPFNADPTGERDATKALQEAINTARDHQLVTFFPPGTYRVSDTLSCIQTRHDPVTKEVIPRKRGRNHPCVLMGSKRGEARPRIVLAPDSPGYGDPERPKYVVHFWSRAVSEGTYDDRQPNISMNQMLVGLDIEIGAGNPGAVALRHRAAQGSAVQDCTIDATHGLCGIEGGIGSGGSSANVTVIGGRYGVDMRETQPTPLLVGFTLIGQTETAILNASRQAAVFVGLRIETDTAGPVIVSEDRGSPHHGQISLIDCQIEFKRYSRDNTCIRTESSITLHDVYVRGTGTVVETERGKSTSDTPAWRHIPEAAYAVTPPPTPAWSGLAGIVYPHAITVGDRERVNFLNTEIIEDVAPPHDLQSRHLWDEAAFPSWESPEAVNVKAAPYNAVGDGAHDDADALQRAIDENEVVFLPRGEYAVSRTIQLRPNTKLIGAHRCFSWIVGMEPPEDPQRRGHHVVTDALPLYDPENPRPILETANDAEGETICANFGILGPQTTPDIYLLRWRTGRNSIFRAVQPHMSFGWSERRDDPELARHPMMLIDGHGGGRFYNWNAAVRMNHAPEFRLLKVAGTRAPLHFYMLNPEYARGSTMIEFDDCQYVSVFAFKGEYNEPLLTFRNGDHFRLFGHGGNAAAFPGKSLFVVERTPNFLLTNLVDSPRMPGAGSPDESPGIGVDPREWHMLAGTLADGSPFNTPGPSRPVLYRQGAPKAAP